MKHLLIATLMMVFCSVGIAGDKKVYESIALPDVDGDLVPWPWGTECPFPWNKVEGGWQVKGKYGQKYDRNTLVFETAEDVKGGVKLLYIYHYNQGGVLRAQGVGYSDSENKIIKAIMTNSNGKGLGYQIIVRTYAQGRGVSCRLGKLSVAVTFCPARGKKCLENENYLLIK